MGERPLIVPFQIETYVTNNKNTPDKNCAQISPDYTKAEYTSYLGGKLRTCAVYGTLTAAGRGSSAFYPAGMFQTYSAEGRQRRLLLGLCGRSGQVGSDKDGSPWRSETVL